jgi:hypothetical protein
MLAFTVNLSVPFLIGAGTAISAFLIICLVCGGGFDPCDYLVAFTVSLVLGLSIGGMSSSIIDRTEEARRQAAIEKTNQRVERERRHEIKQLESQKKKDKRDARDRMVAEIPPEWNQLRELVAANNLRCEGKFEVVRTLLEDLPKISINQQAHVTNMLVCSGSRPEIETNRNRLSKILALHIDLDKQDALTMYELKHPERGE